MVTNPVDLESFKALMVEPLIGFCQVFPSTLKKAARYWYSSLKPISVHSLDQLSHSFVLHFISSKRLQWDFDSLINIKQGERESLRSYMSRFNAVAPKVYNLDHAVTMTAIKSGLQRCPFLFSLEKRVLADFSEKLATAKKYACIEEAYKLHNPLSNSIIKKQLSTQEFHPRKWKVEKLIPSAILENSPSNFMPPVL